ncbi:YjbE family putative metal transport protein [[Pseudomonas] carboxydohydrogena]|uniref:YjbE family putative metal transport protein n=1 Tax=Afipia carboxydohydrogena TaxID=290 RepID=A0ABY8BN48_AFICR|nr:YjbE family putative metal transport protein [[Pseudomonas] carboxydohydrogena]
MALTKIIWINILLSGDNALVIALACRSLEPRQRMWGMVLGAGVAVFLRIIFTFIVASLLALPYLKLVGGIALLVIAAKLLVPEKHEEDNVQAAQHLWAAVKIVAVADIIMSLDNVIAVAAAANGSVVLLVLGLLISIPMIIAGAALIMALLDRVPALVWLGAALLGWVAGEVIATDPGVHPYLQRVLDGQISLNIDPTSSVFSLPSHMQAGTNLGELVLGLLGVAIVLIVGSIWRKRALSEHAAVPAEATT